MTFAQVRARLAIASGQCMGYAPDVDSEQFKKFLQRHKDWTTKGDEWSGAEILRRDGASGGARSVGANHYATLIFQQQEIARASSNAKYCGEALEYFRKWISLDGSALKQRLAEASCAKENLHLAVTPNDN